ncbi:MAG: nucleotide-binding domain containing protein, partial [Pseudomonadota bacterium]
GSAVAMPLPQLYMEEGLLTGDTMRSSAPQLSPKSIILSGSSSSMTNAQVANRIASGKQSLQLDPLALAEDGQSDVLEWVRSASFEEAPLVYATAAPEKVKAAQEVLGVEKAGKIVEDTLAKCALEARDAGVRRFVVAGGETSGAVTKALEVTRLDIADEIAPGVPWTFCVSGGHQIALTLKSGNFGNETFFADALSKLET